MLRLSGLLVSLLAAVPVAGAPSPPAGAQSATVPAAVVAAPDFFLRPGDVLRIRVWPDSSLSGDYPVEETGYVYLPVLGAMQVSAVPLAELRQDLREAYRRDMRAPVVTVTPIFTVSVLGAVQRPGLFQIDPSRTLSDVIGLAGGFREDARDDLIRVIRDGQVLEINARRALETGEAALALNLRSGDQIVVPRARRISSIAVLYVLQSFAILVQLLR